MNPRFLVLVAAVALYWQTTTAIVVPGDYINGGESERITGGEDAKEGEYIFAVSIFYNGEFICTGSIITKMHVLTASHCVIFDDQLQRPELYSVVANVKQSAGQRIPVRYITPHPEYDENDIKNDIAVLEMMTEFEFNETVGPIPLAASEPRKRCIYENYRRVVVMGWGDTKGPTIISKFPDTLQYANQRVVCNKMCMLNEETKLCATGHLSLMGLTLFSSVCNGDSGGPLVEILDEGNKLMRQLGITSYGRTQTCGLGKPEVFTRVHLYQSFINNVTDNRAKYI